VHVNWQAWLGNRQSRFGLLTIILPNEAQRRNALRNGMDRG
jgi:hypothetical protein